MSGTPIIGFPYHGEQELNLALAERQGMAKRLPIENAQSTLFIEEAKNVALPYNAEQR